MKAALYPASMTGRLAHTLVVISLSVLYCGVITSWMSIRIYRLLLASNYRILSFKCWVVHALEMGVRIWFGV